MVVVFLILACLLREGYGQYRAPTHCEIQRTGPSPEWAKPKCNPDGSYKIYQCDAYTRTTCWCVYDNGQMIPGTTRKVHDPEQETRDLANCEKARKNAPSAPPAAAAPGPLDPRLGYHLATAQVPGQAPAAGQGMAVPADAIHMMMPVMQYMLPPQAPQAGGCPQYCTYNCPPGCPSAMPQPSLQPQPMPMAQPMPCPQPCQGVTCPPRCQQTPQPMPMPMAQPLPCPQPCQGVTCPPRCQQTPQPMPMPQQMPQPMPQPAPQPRPPQIIYVVPPPAPPPAQIPAPMPPPMAPQQCPQLCMSSCPPGCPSLTQPQPMPQQMMTQMQPPQMQAPMMMPQQQMCPNPCTNPCPPGCEQQQFMDPTTGHMLQQQQQQFQQQQLPQKQFIQQGGAGRFNSLRGRSKGLKKAAYKTRGRKTTMDKKRFSYRTAVTLPKRLQNMFIRRGQRNQRNFWKTW
eukprot:Seg909.17 transcript_id=Seg909.17/GoldUCD/mRNA.D3Y31 product="hypothetical protein" protein_id=Seg909.17/GoldUCD/D3Y31